MKRGENMLHDRCPDCGGKLVKKVGTVDLFCLNPDCLGIRVGGARSVAIELKEKCRCGKLVVRDGNCQSCLDRKADDDRMAWVASVNQMVRA